MFKPLPVAIGLRYTRAKRRNHFISFISVVSMVGLVLGVTALITVLSVMNGFERELRERILGMASHATIQALDGSLREWEAVREQVEGADPRVLAAAPYVSGEAMLSAFGNISGALIRGIEPALERRVARIGEHMIRGELEDLESGEFRIVLGLELAAQLGVRIGDRVVLMAPQAAVTPAGVLPRMRRFEVVGLFEVGMYEFDRGTAFIHLDDARAMFQTGEGVTGLRLHLTDLMQAGVVSRDIARSLEGMFRVGDWTQQHANLFRAIQMEKVVMFIILSLIVAVAAFNIVSTLVMLVTDKQSDIAILRTLGLKPLSVMLVFIVQGAVIGLVGIVLGVIGGVSLALNIDVVVPLIERITGTQFLAADVYYISDLPSELRMQDVIRISVLAFVLTLLATLFPAWRAARTRPAEALRYE
ncbi:Lipoprotein releasing system transmembrane protein LolC [Thioalkalivibrio nitratireducens DSM 14787]|uniref:Lipoprotein releasing system transmembrane protein LolC n=1 Tax=Thioalkalivibrio nitratireducens (strain DSM 14787 / UNIQEM 213 / ALEN2) TaxID=1255043 RepID=L0DWZ4_THIND|nr:lipoprotein-releasing ABC transporter permease subunit [Thioalkalivibrio nitratireducens]AGA33480.1 Lipoprotein releasing system transmembrane protein LolC [Thioalkalivibrio nitratireducens DSM 14787]